VKMIRFPKKLYSEKYIIQEYFYINNYGRDLNADSSNREVYWESVRKKANPFPNQERGAYDFKI
jgi:hypothetical protein